MGLTRSVPWEDIREVFNDSRGELMDISVKGITAADWQLFLDHCRSLGVNTTFTLDRIATALPNTIEEAFAFRSEQIAMLSISLSGLVLNCHFFEWEAIEMDIDSRELTPERFELLLEWMKTLAGLFLKDVELVHEVGEVAILRYSKALEELQVVRPPN